jgi:hypothetical protein
MANSYEAYASQCATENAQKLTARNTLMQYHRNHHGHRKGVILAYRDGDEVRVGASLCHRSEKRGFDREVGINKALHNAIPLQQLATPVMIRLGVFRSTVAWREIPNSLHKEVKAMVQRAYKYFKDLPTPALNTEGEIDLPANESEYKTEAGKLVVVPYENNEGYSLTDLEQAPEFPPELEPYKRELEYQRKK